MEYKLIVFIGALLLIKNGTATTDPCEEGNHGYLDMLDDTRDVSYFLPIDDIAHCDLSLDSSWRRLADSSRSSIYYVMPEECVQQYHCGTDFPIWLNTTHPNDTDIVTATACLSEYYPPSTTEAECCASEIEINIKRCELSGDSTFFYIYQFPEVSSCPAAYCGMRQGILFGYTDAPINEDTTSSSEHSESNENSNMDEDDDNTVFYIVIAILTVALAASLGVNAYAILNCMRKKVGDGDVESSKSSHNKRSESVEKGEKEDNQIMNTTIYSSTKCSPKKEPPLITKNGSPTLTPPSR